MAQPAFWRNEDWLAVLLGAGLIGAALAGRIVPPPKTSWATDAQSASLAADLRPAVEALAAEASAANDPALAAAAGTLAKAPDRTALVAALKGFREAAKASKAEAPRKRAERLAKELGTRAEAAPAKVFGAANLGAAGLWGLVLLAVSLPGAVLLGVRPLSFIPGFAVVYVLSVSAQLVAGNAGVHALGLEYVLFALAFGLVAGNLLPLPAWLREAGRTEYFIKTGIVLLGAGVLFQEIVKAGLPGVVQALLTVLAVWYACFALARRLKVDEELSVMLSTAVSICGVSAAIAACGAIQGDRKKLSYVTSLVLLVALPMMVLMPWAAKALGLPEAVAGAWLGGTLDTSGSVVAAGALVGEKAMQTGVIVKLSQNVLIGLAAFALSAWWAMRKAGPDGAAGRPALATIWERFPKFVLGFIAASLLFSFVIPPEKAAAAKDPIKSLGTAWFALAFVSIGLETRIKDLLTMDRGRPIAVFVGAQAFNILWTLLLAWLFFGGLLFPA